MNIRPAITESVLGTDVLFPEISSYRLERMCLLHAALRFRRELADIKRRRWNVLTFQPGSGYLAPTQFDFLSAQNDLIDAQNEMIKLRREYYRGMK